VCLSIVSDFAIQVDQMGLMVICMISADWRTAE